MKALVLGATGLVGNLLLKKLLSDNSFKHITVITRKPLSFNHEKLDCLEGDLSTLEALSKSSQAFQCDVLFCCLGSTIKKAGSKEAFRKVDFDYPYEAAKILKEQSPEAQLHLISALGADSTSMVFYNKVKGEIEDALIKMNFKKLVIYRPSLILGDRKERRPAEMIGQVLAKFWDPIITAVAPGYAGVEASQIAEIMLLKSKKDFSGNTFIESDEIKLLSL